jgi:hypothetical protein
LILYPATLLKLFMVSRSSWVEFFGLLGIMSSKIGKVWQFLYLFVFLVLLLIALLLWLGIPGLCWIGVGIVGTLV